MSATSVSAISVSGYAGRRPDAPATRPSCRRSVERAAARGPRRLRDRLAGGVLDERVAALERALRVVRGERREHALEVAAAALERGAPRSSAAAPARAGGAARRRERRGVALRRSAPARGASRRSPLGDRAARGRAQLAQLLVQARRGGGRRGAAGARESRGERAGAVERRARRPWRSSRAAASASAARAARAVDRDGGLGGVRRRRARRRPRRRRAACGRCGGRRDEITGTRSSATVRHSVSSQNANRSASEPPPRATTITSTSAHAARSCSARVIAGAAWRSWTGANAHTTRPPQPRRRSPASTSSRALPDSPVTTPMQRGSAGPRAARFCGSNRPSACRRAAQLLELGEQVALAGDAQPR